MSNQSKLFEKELARRNPDWEKIVAAHNDAIEKLQKQLAAEQERYDRLEALHRLMLKESNRQDELIEELREQLAAEREKVKELQKYKGLLDFIREQHRKADSGELGPEYQLR